MPDNFVQEMIAMDRAWILGNFDQWLADKRKEVFDGIRDSEGAVEGEVSAIVDADETGP